MGLRHDFDVSAQLVHLCLSTVWLYRKEKNDLSLNNIRQKKGSHKQPKLCSPFSTHKIMIRQPAQRAKRLNYMVFRNSVVNCYSNSSKRFVISVRVFFGQQNNICIKQSTGTNICVNNVYIFYATNIYGAYEYRNPLKSDSLREFCVDQHSEQTACE